MRKNFIWFLLLLSSLFLLLNGCDTNEAETESTTAVKEAVDSEGNSYSSIIGEDGFLMLGDRNNLAITVDDGEGKPGLNSKGEYVTKTAEFPKTVTVDGEIHTRFFKLKIPENWENTSENLVKIKLKKDSMTAEVTVNERPSQSLEECLTEVEQIVSGVGKVKTEDVKLSFAQAKKLSVANRLSVYVFNVENRTYFVKVSADEKLFEEIDFEKIINTMKFRKGE